ncbi:hypothetical protein MUK42_24948 [Musa troglodytarum]|uniref:Uncharacterized protein n=1 Tax=Musa troglodytarum TaxID=320322 RepID=A0A9E7L4K0_9LILI|nr:hypothetical protein MUK42_24948 [Musa troglodytarum]
MDEGFSTTRAGTVSGRWNPTAEQGDELCAFVCEFFAGQAEEGMRKASKDKTGAKVGGVGGAKQGLHPIFGMWGTSAMIRITRTRPQVLQRKIAGSAANRGVCMTSLARPPGRGVEELDAVFDGLRQVSLLRSSEPLWSHAGRNLGRWLSPASGDEV